jgi:hypothetical protein
MESVRRKRRKREYALCSEFGTEYYVKEKERGRGRGNTDYI